MPRLDAETLELLTGTIREYATKELTEEFLLEVDREDEFPAKVLRDLYDPEQIGLHLLSIPEAYGGLGGGAYDIYRLSEVMAEIDLGVATGVLATFLGADPIIVGGTEEQKQHWFGRARRRGLSRRLRRHGTQAGSDLATLATRAEPVHENGAIKGYKISGRKQWISNGGVAELYDGARERTGRPELVHRREGHGGPGLRPRASPRTSTASATATRPR